MTRSENFVKDMMVMCAWRYASHLGVEHMLGVLHVIKNRQKAGQGTYLHIIDTMDKWHAAPPTTKTSPDVWDRNLLRLLNEVDRIVDDTRPDPTNGATYFGETTNITSSWFLENVARSTDRVRCGDINQFTYWKPKEIYGN